MKKNQKNIPIILSSAELTHVDATNRNYTPITNCYFMITDSDFTIEENK